MLDCRDDLIGWWWIVLHSRLELSFLFCFFFLFSFCKMVVEGGCSKAILFVCCVFLYRMMWLVFVCIFVCLFELFCVFVLCLANYTSVSSSSTFCCRPFAEFRWCCFRGSNASTIICSVPLISARQNGQPCEMGTKVEHYVQFMNDAVGVAKSQNTFRPVRINCYNHEMRWCDCSNMILPVLRSRLAKQSNTVYTANDRMVQSVYLYHFPHIFCITEMCYLLNGKCGRNERNEANDNVQH